MDRRTYPATVARNIVSAIAAAQRTERSVAEATDMELSELESRLTGASDFTLSEVHRVGGFLHIPTHVLMKGAAA